MLAQGSSFKTPVVLIVFKRPQLTKRVFEIVRQIRPPQLFLVADGPSLGNQREIQKCAETRAILDRVDWDCEVFRNYSDFNLGCRNRVFSGLSWVFNLVDRAIILEDDCIPELSFFSFCQELLERYRDDERIMQITGENTHGYQHPESSYYFSRYSFYWGWATWRRAWRLCNINLEAWPRLRESQWLENLLKSQEAADYWSKIFNLIYNGFDSWGWAWTFSCFMCRGLCAIPNHNLISNVGFGVDATHTTWKVDELAHLPTRPLQCALMHPKKIAVDTQADVVIDKRRFSGRKYRKSLGRTFSDTNPANFTQKPK